MSKRLTRYIIELKETQLPKHAMYEYMRDNEGILEHKLRNYFEDRHNGWAAIEIKHYRKAYQLIDNAMPIYFHVDVSPSLEKAFADQGKETYTTMYNDVGDCLTQVWGKIDEYINSKQLEGMLRNSRGQLVLDKYGEPIKEKLYQEIELCHDTTTETCKGRLYRFKKSYFASERGHIRLNCEFVPQKKMSCPGCEDCYYMQDIADDEIIEHMMDYEYSFDKLKHNTIYRMLISFEDNEWMTVEFEECKEEKSDA